MRRGGGGGGGGDGLNFCTTSVAVVPFCSKFGGGRNERGDKQIREEERERDKKNKV